MPGCAAASLDGESRGPSAAARRRGQFRLLDAVEERRISALGVEPLEPDFTPRRLLELTRSSTKPIKIFLMDQRRIAGVGNIQAAESLFLARIHPGREARSLDRTEVARLVRSIQRTLESEIERSRSENPAYLREGTGNEYR